MTSTASASPVSSDLASPSSSASDDFGDFDFDAIDRAAAVMDSQALDITPKPAEDDPLLAPSPRNDDTAAMSGGEEQVGAQEEPIGSVPLSVSPLAPAPEEIRFTPNPAVLQAPAAAPDIDPIVAEPEPVPAAHQVEPVAGAAPSLAQQADKLLADIAAREAQPEISPVELVKRRVGVVMFDGAQPGAGWAVGGDFQSGPVRIDGVGDLATGVLWLTNVDYEPFREHGLQNNAWVRNSGFLRMTTIQVLGEWGLDPERENPAVCAMVLYHVLCCVVLRTSAMIKKVDKHATLTAPTLTQDLSSCWPPAQVEFGTVGQALKQAVQSWTRTTVRPGRDCISLDLRRPRVAHMQDILATHVPVGQATWHGLEKIEPDQRLEWLRSQGRPYLARLQIKTVNPVYADILAFGSGAREDGGKAMRRSWAADPEVTILANLATLEITGAFVFEDSTLLRPVVPGILESLTSPMAANSYSSGLLAENLWLAATKAPPEAFRQARAKGANDTPQVVRAVWLRAADRMQMFMTAMRLHSAGLNVISYGVGAVRVSVPPELMGDAMRCAFEYGLLPPAATPERTQTMAPTAWAGDRTTAVSAVLRAAGLRDLLLSLDSLPDLTMDEAKAEFVRIMNAMKGH